MASSCGTYIHPQFSYGFSHVTPHCRLPFQNTCPNSPSKQLKRGGGNFLSSHPFYPSRSLPILFPPAFYYNSLFLLAHHPAMSSPISTLLPISPASSIPWSPTVPLLSEIMPNSPHYQPAATPPFNNEDDIDLSLRFMWALYDIYNG